MSTLKQFLFLLLTLSLLSSCNEPIPIPSSEWCNLQPCLEIFGISINQISSSILVYALGIYGLFVGYKYYKNSGTEQSRFYWSISLILGGLGALSAGTSFQAFGYELKCAGKDFCDLTSSFEIASNSLMVWSAAFMLMATSASFLDKSWLKTIAFMMLIWGLVYSTLCVVASQLNNYFLVSFEFLLLYITPIYLGIFILMGWYYSKHKDVHTNKYIWAWLVLMLTIIAYYAYLTLGYTEILWAKGIWFSANDVLHIGMMGWLVYLSNYLMDFVVDKK